MKDAQGNLVLGRTRWRRFGLAVVPAVVVAGAIVFGMANGAIAASFAVSGTTFKVSADVLDGDGFVQYGGVAWENGHSPANLGTDSHVHAIAVSGIASATLTNLCQSVVVPGTPITMVIHAGNKGTDVTATNLLLDVSQLQGDATFTNIQIGQDASTLDKGPSGAKGQPGGFGQQATHVHITGLKQVAWSTSAGSFHLADMSLSINMSKDECFPDLTS